MAALWLQPSSSSLILYLCLDRIAATAAVATHKTAATIFGSFQVQGPIGRRGKHVDSLNLLRCIGGINKGCPLWASAFPCPGRRGGGDEGEVNALDSLCLVWRGLGFDDTGAQDQSPADEGRQNLFPKKKREQTRLVRPNRALLTGLLPKMAREPRHAYLLHDKCCPVFHPEMYLKRRTSQLITRSALARGRSWADSRRSLRGGLWHLLGSCVSLISRARPEHNCRVSIFPALGFPDLPTPSRLGLPRLESCASCRPARRGREPREPGLSLFFPLCAVA